MPVLDDRGRLFGKIGRRVERVLLDREQNVDVDDEFDFWLAERVLERRSRRTLGR